MTIVADIALLLWMPLSLVLFMALGRPLPAAFLTILGASLFLPELRGFDLPLMPTLDASRIGLLSAFALTLVLHGRLLLPPRGTLGFLVFPAMIILGPVFTVYTNRDPLFYGPLVLPGLTNHDMISMCLLQTIDFVIPFYLGLCLFRRERDLRFVLQCLAVAGLVYSLLILVELRLSPQLHKWVYGYYQHQFLQTMRWGGYRPMVFMPHGLAVASFLLTSCIAAFSLWHARVKAQGISMLPVAGYLSVVLVACKSVAAMVYGVLVMPLAALGKARTQVRVAALLAALALLYPALWTADLVPVDGMVSLAEAISVDRAASLEFRFVNEGVLIEKARERPLFGWGTWGRNRVYDENFGWDIAVTDGAWIIDLGTFGLVGFIGKFCLLAVPIFAAQRRLKLLRSSRSRVLQGGLSLILAITAVDLLPNGFLPPFAIFLGGGLAALTRELVAEESALRRREAMRSDDDTKTAGPSSSPPAERPGPRDAVDSPPRPSEPSAGIAAGLLTRRDAGQGGSS